MSEEDDNMLLYGTPQPPQRHIPLMRVVADNSAKRTGRFVKPWNEADIPHRPWVAPGFLLRGAVTLIAGPPSAGKSSLVVSWTAALSMGVPFGRFRSFTGEPMKCLAYNVEDDEHELHRRYSGACRRLSATPAELLENLILVGPLELGTLVNVDRNTGELVPTQVMDELDQIVVEEQPDCVFLDPFVELHDTDENDNTGIRAVMAHFRAFARRHNIAVCLLMHTHKGKISPGDPDQVRGASSIIGACRIATTLNVMSADEAKTLGISEEGRRDYVRLDDAKANYSRIQDAEWFERVEHLLDNGDRVATLYPWTPPNLAVDVEGLDKIVTMIAKGSPCGPWSPRLGSEPRSVAHGLKDIGIENKAAQLQALAQIKAAKLVEIVQYKQKRKSREESPVGLRTASGQPRTVEWWDVIEGLVEFPQ